jgi:hypothetical protein
MNSTSPSWKTQVSRRRPANRLDGNHGHPLRVSRIEAQTHGELCWTH